MINHQKHISAFLITVLFVSLLSFSIPQNHEPLEENVVISLVGSDTSGEVPYQAPEILDIFTQDPYYEYVYTDDGVVPMIIQFTNLVVGEEYTIQWKQERYDELIESGSITFTGDNETNEVIDDTRIYRDNVTFEINASSNREIFSINASLMSQNGTELHWYSDVRSTYYGWDWVHSETDWTCCQIDGDTGDVEGSWGDVVTNDYTFTHLNPEQEYNMSWILVSNRAYGEDSTLIEQGNYSIITPDADGNYETSVSFQMLESWESDHVCIEYTIKIDETESLGQTLRKCIHFNDERPGLPSISGIATIMSVLCAAIIFTPTRHSSGLNEHDES